MEFKKIVNTVFHSTVSQILQIVGCITGLIPTAFNKNIMEILNNNPYLIISGFFACTLLFSLWYTIDFNIKEIKLLIQNQAQSIDKKYEEQQKDLLMLLNMIRSVNAVRIKNELSYMVSTYADAEQIEKARQKEAALLFENMQKMYPEKVQEVKELVDLFYR